MTSRKAFYDQEKKDEQIEPSPPLQDNAMYFPGGGRITPVRGVYFGDSEIGTRKLVPRDASEIQKTIDNLNALGGGVVFLKNGTYLMTSDLTLYSNIYIDGENRDLTFLDFQDNTKSIIIKGSDAYTTGTISVSFGSSTVTGSGTSWTSSMVGREILLSGVWYPIAAVGGSTSITLGLPYGAKTLSGATYTIATTISDTRVENITIKNALYGVDMQYAKDIYLTNVKTQTSAIGIKIDTSANLSIVQTRNIACNEGYNLNKVSLINMNECGAIDTAVGNAMTLASCRDIAINNVYIIGSAADGINFTSCEDISIDGTIKSNVSNGIELVSGNNNITVSNSAIEDNVSDGIKITATSDNCFVSFCSLANNGGYGVNIAASSVDNTNITGNNFSGNSSGAVNDSGTGTVIRGNVGVSDNSTGAQQITQNIDTFIAAESISDGEAVYMIPGASPTPTSIATDATSSAQQASGTSVTVSHTCTGSNLVLIGALTISNSGVSNVAMTYNSVAMTLIGTKTVGGVANRDVYLFYLVNPATGSNTLSATWSGTSTAELFGSSYTGASMVNQPDSSATGNTTDGSTHISVATTVVASNCWLVGVYRMDSNNSTTYDSGTTARVVYQPNQFQGQGILDSNGTVATGSRSLGVTVSEASIVGAMVVASILPFQGTVAKADASVAGTSDTFVGFANEAASAKADIDVVISGAKTGLSGLNSGKQYYLSDTTGAISTTAGTVTRKVGIAISTTKLLITNIW